MNRFNIGIIGCGAISADHVSAYQALSGVCTIQAVSDLDLSRAENLARSIGGHVTAYADYRDMLRREDIDVVSVCTPPSVHKSPVVEALHSGKHVLCEKPFAPSLADCDEMIAASTSSGCKLAVVFQYRFRQDFNQIKAILDSGVMGPTVHAQMNGLYWRGDRYYQVPWRGKWASECGGVTMNQAIHPLDIFLWLLGDVTSVYAEMDTLTHEIEVEDSLLGILRFRSGAVGQIACSTSVAGTEISMKISSKNASIALDGVGEALTLHTKKDTGKASGEADEDLRTRIAAAAQFTDTEACAPDTSHVGSIQDLFDSIREDRDPRVSGSEGRRSIEVITALYKSGSTGSKVSLPLCPSDPWYSTRGILEGVKRGAAIRS